MLERKEVHRALSDFGKDVVVTARSNFLAKNASGRGARSILYNLQTGPRSFDLDFEMENYMEYQDKGVKGTVSGESTAGYKYTNKKPPASAFDMWGIRRGLAPRDTKGRFLKRKSLNFALANHIFKHGIKPSLFFTKAFEKHFKYLPEEITTAYQLDVEQMMKATLNSKDA